MGVTNLRGLEFDTETQRFRERRTANGFATEITENDNDNGGKDVYGNGQRPTARTQRTANSNGNGMARGFLRFSLSAK
jgi:hypothetical protein